MIEPAEPVRSSSVLTNGFRGVTIDSLATRPRASMPACAPSNVKLLLRKRFSTGRIVPSTYVPAQTRIVSPELEAFMAAWIDVKVAVGH